MKRNLEGIVAEFPSRKEVKYSCGVEDDDLVTIQLIDLIPNHEYQKLLIKRFDHQQKGKALWSFRRELKTYEYIPIEFSNDKYFVSNFLTGIANVPSANYSPNILDCIDMGLWIDEDILLALNRYHIKNKSTYYTNQCLSSILNADEYRHVGLKILATCYADMKNIFQDLKTVVGNLYDEYSFSADEILYMVKYNGLILESFPNHRSCKDIVREAVHQNPSVIDLLHDKIVEREFFLESIERRENFDSSFIIPEHLIEDREVVLKVVKKCGVALEQLSETLKSDREIVLNSVRSNGCALRYANKKFLNDTEIIREALCQNGVALKFLGTEYKNDREMVLTAVKSNSQAFLYADESLHNDQEILLETLKNPYPYIVEVASKSILLENRELALKVVKQNGLLITSLPEKLMKDRDILLAAVPNFNLGNKTFFTYFEGEFQDFLFSEIDKDFSVCLECLKKDVETLIYACESQFKEEAMLEGLRLYKQRALRYLSFMCLSENVDFFKRAVRVFGGALEYAPLELKSDRETVLTAIRQYGPAIKHSKVIDTDLVVEAACLDITILNEIFNEEYVEICNLVAIKTGKCSKLEGNIFEKRVEYEYFGAILQLDYSDY